MLRACRRKILRQYAKHLGDADIAQLAAATERMSGRDLRDIAEQTERAWASRVRSEGGSAAETENGAVVHSSAILASQQAHVWKQDVSLPYILSIRRDLHACLLQRYASETAVLG